MRGGPTTGNPTGRIEVVLRRLIMTLIAAVAVGGLVFAFSGPTQEDDSKLPPAVEAVFPVSGNLELRQVTVVADLAAGYTGYLAIDGNEVPEDDVRFEPALNTLTLRPQPDSDFAQLEAGSHCATVFYRQIGQPRTNSSDFLWCFRLH